MLIALTETPAEFEIVSKLTATAQAHDMLREAAMLQSDRDLHEHAFGPAKTEPADHMQDARHSPELTSGVLGRDMIGMFNEIFNWLSFDGVCRD